jgi:uncharacterized DUF497 family protein
VITWDEAKRARNISKHRLDFADVAEFDFATAATEVDDRDDYGETREKAIGWFRARLCVLVYVIRNGDLHVISFRKASRTEASRYVDT